MKNILIVLLLSITFGGFSQEENLSNNTLLAPQIPESVRIDASLYQIGQTAIKSLTSAQSLTQSMDLRTRETDGQTLINVEIVYKNDYNATKIIDEINTAYLESLGFKVETQWKNRASIWVNASEIISKGSKLDKDYFMFAVHNIRHDNEGPGLMNSSSYSGTGGSGRRVAIFDSGFGSLSSASTNGHVPASFAYMWRNGSVVSTIASMSSGSIHGTACVETVFDHAPNATYELYDVGNNTEKGAAVTLCKAHGVDVISMSLSTYNTGWADNTGPACAAADDAGDNGILFFTSCGNRAETHWEGSFSDSDNDSWHQFSGTDEGNNRTVGNEGTVVAYLSWNPVVNSNYDVYLYRSDNNALLASSTNSGTTFETASWTNNTGSSVNFYIAVKKVGSASPTFELFSHDDGTDYQYQVAAGSNTSPSNSTNNNVISIGAVPRTSYNSASGTSGIIASYSSQGPTNSGNLAPKAAAPTNTTTFVYGGAFTGTSCATPNAAGMATAFWANHSYLDATGVRQILFKKADLYKDWGLSNSDNIYGNGGLFLYDYFANTRYLYRDGNNTTGLSYRPVLYLFTSSNRNS